MEFYGNRFCISMRELVDGGIMTMPNYKAMSARGRIDVVRRGGGSAGSCALVAVDSLPSVYKEKVEEVYPGGPQVRLQHWILSNYEMDQAAVAFFHDRQKTRLDLSEEKKREYIINASVLNCCIKLYNRAATAQKLFGGKYNWEMMSATIETLRKELGHTLPASTLRFRKKVNEYQQFGYGCLISGKFGNQCARKVDYKTERLILGLAVLPNKPFNSTTHDNYISFVCGELDVFDPITGELFNPDDFMNKKTGEPLELSESTIANYLNKPNNKLLIEKKLSSWTTFMHEQMPHMHRHGGDWSLSQITMDDVDLKRRMPGNKYVHVYRAWDVVSQCVVGVSYCREKDQRLVVDCFRGMFRLFDKHGWGMPAGIEVENHLMTQYKDGFLQAGVAFPFVHFCAPQNSQEKYAEPLNAAFQRFLHERHEGQGRFYGKGKWRIDQKKVSDENNHTFEDKRYYSWEQLTTEDQADIEAWNHLPHPNQKKYPGMTRWDVLVERVNPDLQPLNKITLSRYVGERVETSIRRNSTIRVAYEDWWLSGPDVLEKLEPNNMKVTAYYLPDEEGNPTDVYLFQGDRYIDKVEKVETYNRVMAEQTDEDMAKYIEQRKKVAKFEKYVRDHEIDVVGVMKKEAVDEIDAIDEIEVIDNIDKTDEVEELYDTGWDPKIRGVIDM